jgi:hypothetical protein
MLQVYDRVVSSGSYSTLAMLTLLMVALTAALGGFEWVRSMILIAASNRIEKNLRRRVSDATFKRALLTGGSVSNSQPLSDLSSLRQVPHGQWPIRLFRCALVPDLRIRDVHVSPDVWVCGNFCRYRYDRAGVHDRKSHEQKSCKTLTASQTGLTIR